MSDTVLFVCKFCEHLNSRRSTGQWDINNEGRETYFCAVCDALAGEARPVGLDFVTRHVRTSECVGCARELEEQKKQKLKQEQRKAAREEGKKREEEHKAKLEAARIKKLEKEKKWKEEEEAFQKEIEERERNMV